MNAAELIDLQSYPIGAPDTQAYADMIQNLRADLKRDGCAVLKGFVTGDALAQLVAEADSVAAHGHASHSRTNAYFSQPDADLPDSHPINRFYDRSNAFIPADNFGAQSPLRAIYEYPPFMPFVRAALDEPQDRFFRYDDPLADVIINMVEDGDGFPWHFDTNNYTVTLAIQNADEGGAFEYAPWLRTSTDECFDAVQAVLEDRSDSVKTLVLEPGDLQIFKGRYALHRVKPVKGNRKRYVGIFSFVETEGMCGSVERTRQLYGRVLPRHYAREGLRSDGLLD
jgi:hypothetical protein